MLLEAEGYDVIGEAPDGTTAIMEASRLQPDLVLLDVNLPDLDLALPSTHEDQKVVTAILGPLIGLSFIGTGVFAWWRRPLNRFGLLMTGVGIAWFLAGLTESNNSTVFTIGSYVEPLYLVI